MLTSSVGGKHTFSEVIFGRSKYVKTYVQKYSISHPTPKDLLNSYHSLRFFSLYLSSSILSICYIYCFIACFLYLKCKTRVRDLSVLFGDISQVPRKYLTHNGHVYRIFKWVNKYMKEEMSYLNKQENIIFKYLVN